MWISFFSFFLSLRLSLSEKQCRRRTFLLFFFFFLVTGWRLRESPRDGGVVLLFFFFFSFFLRLYFLSELIRDRLPFPFFFFFFLVSVPTNAMRGSWHSADRFFPFFSFCSVVLLCFPFPPLPGVETACRQTDRMSGPLFSFGRFFLFCQAKAGTAPHFLFFPFFRRFGENGKGIKCLPPLLPLPLLFFFLSSSSQVVDDSFPS